MKLDRYAQLYLLQAEDGESGGGGDDAAPEATFTQADVDRIVKRRVKDMDALKATIAEQKEQLAEAMALRDEFEALKAEKEDAGKSQIEQLTSKHERALAAMQKKLDEIAAGREAAEKAAAEARDGLRNTIVRQSVTEGFVKAKVLSSASADAISSFLASAEIEVGEDNKIESITYGDLDFTSVDEAAKAFLKNKPYFSSAPSGGSGTPGGTGAPMNGKGVDDMTSEELLAMGFAQPPRGPRTEDQFDK